MPAWLVWLIVAAAFAGAETVSLSFVLVMFAGGAAAATVVAAVGGGLLPQFLVAIAVTLVLLVGFRPIARRHLTVPLHHSGSDRLVGTTAVVLTQVTGFEGGLVRLNGGDWSARSAYPELALPPGAVVRVIRIEGATAVVGPEVGEWRAE